MITKNSAAGKRCACGRGVFILKKETTTRDDISGEILEIEETYECSDCGQTLTLTIYKKLY